MPTKKQSEKFNKDVISKVLKLGGEIVTTNGTACRMKLQTISGELTISVHEADKSSLYSIFCCFEDVKLTNEMLPVNLKFRLNDYSGKFNFHFVDKEDCLYNFGVALNEIVIYPITIK